MSKTKIQIADNAANRAKIRSGSPLFRIHIMDGVVYVENKTPIGKKLQHYGMDTTMGYVEVPFGYNPRTMQNDSAFFKTQKPMFGMSAEQFEENGFRFANLNKGAGCNMHGYKPHPDSFGYTEEDAKWHPMYSHLSPEHKSTEFTNTFFFCRNKNEKQYKHIDWMIAPARRVVNKDECKQYYTVLSGCKQTRTFPSGYIRGNNNGWFTSRRAAERFAAEIRAGLHPQIMQKAAEWDKDCASWNACYDDDSYYESKHDHNAE